MNLADVKPSAIGILVKRVRESRGWTQTELGAKIGVDGQTISNLESGRTKTLKLKYLALLPAALEMSREEVIPLAPKERGEASHNVPAPPARPLATRIGEIPLRPVPVSDGLPAGQFDEMPMDTPTWEMPTNNPRAFAAVLRGTCMEPAYPDRSAVLFEPVDQARDLKPGACYYVGTDDGAATFKQLVRIDPDTITLWGLNHVVCPVPLVVRRTAIIKMAKAVFTVRPSEDLPVPLLPGESPEPVTIETVGPVGGAAQVERADPRVQRRPAPKPQKSPKPRTRRRKSKSR